MDDGMGTSMVIVHTEKGKKVWNAVKGETAWFACKKEEVLQPRLLTPTAVAKNRGYFMMLYRMLPFPVFAKLFLLSSAVEGILRRVRRCNG